MVEGRTIEEHKRIKATLETSGGTVLIAVDAVSKSRTEFRPKNGGGKFSPNGRIPKRTDT